MSEIQQGLLITAIGMGLVFAVIIFLWGMMALLLRLTSREKKVADEGLEPSPEIEQALETEFSVIERQRRAAAVAVAYAISADELSGERSKSEAQTTGLNAWQMVHRARQIDPRRTQG